MARKRSRSNTEQRFQEAVLEMVAESGCAHLGVNAIAEAAGYDKVLIYRYFGDLEGLLQRVAESRSWLPTAEALRPALSKEPNRVLSELTRLISHHVRMDRATHQVCLWRHAVKNPLTEQYTTEWKTLWRALPEQLGSGLDYEARKDWSKACALLALTIEAELADEAIETGSLDILSTQLEAPNIQRKEEARDDGNTLPTNLL